MADASGDLIGSCCGGACASILAAIGINWSTQSTAGSRSCGWCDTCCRCKCCWDEGEFNPDDFPQNDGAGTKEKDGAYPTTAQMAVPAGEPAPTSAPAETPAERA